MVDLSVVIVSWNVKDRLRENLKKLFASQGNFSFEVYVVDNNSADKTVEMVHSEFPQVNLIANEENVGFSKANNQAIAEIMRVNSGKISKYILLLNPDMEVKTNTLINMLKWMEANPGAGVAGCHLIDENGKTVPSVRNFPNLWDQLAIVLKLPHVFPHILDNYLQAKFDYTKAKQVSSVRGGFFMMNTQAFKNRPLLDEIFFLWFEEVDFCRHLYKYSDSGEVWYTPAAECVDHVGQSFKQLSRGQSQDYFRDSQLKYFKKWKPTWQYYILKLAWPIGILIAKWGEKAGVKSKANT